jgi:hypothetical protein
MTKTPNENKIPITRAAITVYKQWVGALQECADSLPNKGSKRPFDFARGACIQGYQTHSKNTRGTCRFPHFGPDSGGGRIDQMTDRRDRGHDFVQQLKTLCDQL